MSAVFHTSCAGANELTKVAKLPKECTYCDDQDWTCSVCLDDASPEYYRCDETNEVVCFDDTMRQVVTSCGHRFHEKCLEDYTTVKMNGDIVGVIPCPNCRTDVFVDKRDNKKMFEWLISCDCCTRHMTNRPTTYAYDEDIENLRQRPEQEAARRNLTDKEYEVWCMSNAQRRNRDRDYCDCPCRQEARIAIRRIPFP